MGSSRRSILIILALAGGLVAILLALPLLSVAAYWAAQRIAAFQYREVSSIASVPPEDLRFFEFQQEFRINTADVDAPRFVRARISLGYGREDRSRAEALTSREPQLRNVINLILASKKAAEFDTAAGRSAVGEEIRASLNHLLGADAVKVVQFQELAVN